MFFSPPENGMVTCPGREEEGSYGFADNEQA